MLTIEYRRHGPACALVAGAGYSTAYLVLTRMAGLKAGRTVRAPGIEGSVGMGTVEVARELGASLDLTTASRTDKAEYAGASKGRCTSPT